MSIGYYNPTNYQRQFFMIANNLVDFFSVYSYSDAIDRTYSLNILYVLTVVDLFNKTCHN